MVRSNMLCSLVALLILACGLEIPRADAAAQQANQRPNIVLFLCDDLGISSTSYTGADPPFKTPQIDALAARSLRFDRCFSAPVCGPSRAQLMTGQYAFRHGVLENSDGAKLDPKTNTVIAQELRKAGYRTAAAGKWSQLQHLSDRESGAAWGFDEFMLWTGFGTNDRYWAPRYNHNGTVRTWDEKTYGPDVLQQFVIDFIAKDKDKPFFIYYSNPIPHAPRTRTPDSKNANPDDMEMYADQIAYLDKQVATFVADLERLGVRENTLLLFVGDNGSPSGGGTVRGRRLDGGKGSAGESACRVPMFVSWPAVIPEGRDCSDLVDFSDFFPTFSELAGAPLQQSRTIDGRSFAPQLKGEKGHPREWVYASLMHPTDPIRWVRDDHFRLNGKGVLTSVKDAPFGDTPVDESDPQAQAARQRLQKVLDSLK